MVWLNNSRIIAIFAVVFLHVSAGVVSNSPVGYADWFIGNVYDSLVRWCVPVLVMISGALLLDPNKKEDVKTFYLKRLSKILIPILFWSAFFLLFKSLKSNRFEIQDAARRLMSGRPYYHMWFLYMIIFLYIFTPFFKKIISNSSRLEIEVLVISTLFIAAINTLAKHLGETGESKLFITRFLYYIPYFFIGYLVRFYEFKHNKRVLLVSFVLSVLLTAFGCYLVARNNGLDAGLYFYSYLSITVIPMSVSIMYLFKLWTKPIGNEYLTEKLASLTLGVYLIHPIFLEIIQDAWPGYQAVSPAISIPLASAVVFTLSLSAAWVIRRIPYVRKII